MSKPKHETSVEFVVYGDHALFSDILTRPGSEKTSYSIRLLKHSREYFIRSIGSLRLCGT